MVAQLVEEFEFAHLKVVHGDLDVVRRVFFLCLRLAEEGSQSTSLLLLVLLLDLGAIDLEVVGRTATVQNDSDRLIVSLALVELLECLDTPTIGHL